MNFQTFAGEWSGNDFTQPFGDDNTYSQSITLPDFKSDNQRDAIDAANPPDDDDDDDDDGGDGGKKSFAAASQVGLVSLFLAVTAVLSA